MGYSDVMPLSMLQHVQMNLDEYRGNGKKSKKSLGDEFEEKINPGQRLHNSALAQLASAKLYKVRYLGSIERMLMQSCDVCDTGDEESEIRAQVKLWEENSDVHDLTRQAVDLFVDDVR